MVPPMELGGVLDLDLLPLDRFGDEDSPLVWRWVAVLEACSRSLSAEVLRLAAARSLQTAGMEVLRQSLGAAHPWLVPAALR